MSGPQRHAVTELLAAVGRGEAAARDRLWALIYDELLVVAQRQLAYEAAGHRRRPTSLVHDAYLRLTNGEHVEFANRKHFFAAAARAMRQIRIDDARKRNRLKRGGPDSPAAVPLDAVAAASADGDSDPATLLAVDEALKQLEAIEPRKAEVVMLRYYCGLSVDETADALGVSARTVDSDWHYARAWLHRALSGD